MSYNHYKEKKRWNEWKAKEEKLLRKLSVSEEIIKKLRDYDYLEFNKERKYHEHVNVTEETFFKMQAYEPNKEIQCIEDLLDEIQNEALYEILRNQDETTLKIILLKVYGYNAKEIAKLLKINVRAVYYRMKKIKNLF